MAYIYMDESGDLGAFENWGSQYFIINTNFIEYLKSKKYELFKFEFKISTPNQIKWLEVVDAISFAIEQKYEKWDLELYSVIKNKIILEKQIFN
jgi:hypothetical protein